MLILFSNDRLLPANLRYDTGIRRALDPEGKQLSVAFFAEFLDATRFGGAEREAVMEEYLKKRYQNLPPQVLVALGPEALDFLLARRASLFPGVPLLFGGASRDELNKNRDMTGVAGLPMELNVKPMVEELLSMRPQTREIVFLHGTAKSDRNWREVALRQCAALQGRIKFTDGPELPLPELKAYLATLSQDAAVFYFTYFQGPTGETYIPVHVAADIAPPSSVPMMGLYDTYVGTGVLGVSVSPFEEDGMVLGKVIRRVLDGEKTENIGILPPNPPRLILDARQMARWGIKSAPAGAEVRYRSPTLWEEHQTGVIITVSVIALQGLLIAGLIFVRLRQKRAEKELRLSEALFSGVFRGSPAAISIIRQSDGRIIDVNPEWETITGVPRAQAMGRTPIETGMLIEGDAEGRFRQFLESGRPLHDYEQAVRTPDGRTRWLSLSTELHTLHDEPCYVMLAKDVTAAREAEKASQQIAHTSRLAMLGEMTASISHEINQPLGAILSNTDAAEMLLERTEPPLGEVKQILADIRRDDLRASEVIKRVRSLIGHRQVRRATLDLNEALLESLHLASHEARRRGITLIHELAENLPRIHADAVQIEQVVLNLLLNAMDAMEATPVAARRIVLRSSARNGDSVEAVVEDSGQGIPPEKLGQVFDSFFTTKEGGMGLGLALARSIAEAHGGHLFAENNASGGATFHLILPLNFSSADDLSGV